MEFKCLKCAECCKNLIHDEYGLLRGMSLFPEETGLFPTEYVFPSLGMSYGRQMKTVIFQLGIAYCPHLEGQRCGVYDRRPLACQGYPLIIESKEPSRVNIEFHCRWFKQDVVAKGLEEKLYKEPIVAPKEIEAGWLIYERLEEFKRSKEKWYFDLRSKKWYKPKPLGQIT